MRSTFGSWGAASERRSLKSDQDFSNCGWDCLDDAWDNSNCHTNDDIKCVCEDPIAKEQASTCISDQCSASDINQFSLAVASCNNDISEPGPTTRVPTPSATAIPTEASTAALTTTSAPATTALPPSTPTSALTTTASTSPPPATSASATTKAGGTGTGNGGAPSTSPPASTASQGGTSVSGPAISLPSSSQNPPQVSSSPPTSTHGAMSDTMPQVSDAVTDGTTSEGATATSSTQGGTGQRGLSPKVLITLIVAISMVIIIALILVVVLICMRRRRRRRSRGAAPAEPLKDIKVTPNNEGAAWARKDEQQRAAAEGDLAAVSARPQVGTPALTPNRPSTFTTSGSTVFCPGTSLQSPQSEYGESTRPLLYQMMSDSCTMDTVGEEALSPPGTSSTQYGTDIWSTDGIVGEDLQAQGGTLDIGLTGGSGSGVSDQSALEHGPLVHAHADSNNVRDNEKRATILGDDGAEGTSHASLPVVPAPPLPPSAPPAGNTPPPSRLSNGPRGPRFVTVLMEVREDDLEEQDQPPPYQPRSHSRSQELGSVPVSAIGGV